MRRAASVLITVCVMAVVSFLTGFAQADGGEDILKGMMSDDQMTAYQALGKLRSGGLAGDRMKLELAKKNLVVLLGNSKKDYNIRMLAADTAAYFDVKKAIPVLRSVLASEENPVIKITYQNALDRLEGRIKGEKYREYKETPSYRGTPGYYGTPRFHGTPRR